MGVSSYNTVTSFFDESGKFKDHRVISFGGVSSYNEDFPAFAEEWNRLLVKNGLSVLHAKEALRFKVPLSARNTRIGLAERIADLTPFILCIRKHLSVVTGVAIDVAAFKKLPQHFFKTYGNDPIFVSFARALLKVVEFTPDNDKISFTCDDDEESSVDLFRLWRRVKRVFPGAKQKLVAMCFADDRFLFALQAADLVSSIVRLQAHKQFFHTPYDYTALFESLSEQPQKHEKLWDLQIAFADNAMLTGLAKGLDEARRKTPDGTSKSVGRPRSHGEGTRRQ